LGLYLLSSTAQLTLTLYYRSLKPAGFNILAPNAVIMRKTIEKLHKNYPYFYTTHHIDGIYYFTNFGQMPYTTPKKLNKYSLLPNPKYTQQKQAFEHNMLQQKGFLLLQKLQDTTAIYAQCPALRNQLKIVTSYGDTSDIFLIKR
jgi:hypothetical protein